MTRPTKRQLEQRVVRAAMRWFDWTTKAQNQFSWCATDKALMKACAALRAKRKR